MALNTNNACSTQSPSYSRAMDKIARENLSAQMPSCRYPQSCKRICKSLQQSLQVKSKNVNEVAKL
uniref:Uncharacterized protein n=1 Tax=Rhizophora mucronata TaxID=61149 RepID=A0A2P2MSH9_RHIMU